MKTFIFILMFLVIGNTYALDDTIIDAKITKVEFYGSQFTVYFDKTHTATGCGHPGSVVAMNSSDYPGKAHMAVFLSAWNMGKLVSVRVTDSICSGDRPTLIYFNAK